MTTTSPNTPLKRFPIRFINAQGEDTSNPARGFPCVEIELAHGSAIPGKVNRQRILALVDTGADMNVASLPLMDALEAANAGTIANVQGHHGTGPGTLRAAFMAADDKTNILFVALVSDIFALHDSPYSAIIGRETLRFFRLVFEAADASKCYLELLPFDPNMTPTLELLQQL